MGWAKYKMDPFSVINRDEFRQSNHDRLIIQTVLSFWLPAIIVITTIIIVRSTIMSAAAAATTVVVVLIL